MVCYIEERVLVGLGNSMVFCVRWLFELGVSDSLWHRYESCLGDLACSRHLADVNAGSLEDS